MHTDGLLKDKVDGVGRWPRLLAAGSVLMALMMLAGCPPTEDRTALRDIELSVPSDLSPAFDPARTDYETGVSILAQGIAVTATPVDPEATIRINGMEVRPGQPSPVMPLSLGENVIEIEVETPEGERRTYTILVNRAEQVAQQLYAKPFNTDPEDYFGWSISMVGDTLAVSAPFEDSAATGINNEAFENTAPDSGAVYVFRRDGQEWVQEAYLKASNTDAGDGFGWNLAMIGNTLVVGAPFEDSAATGIGGDARNNDLMDSGAVYVFQRRAGTWTQTAYIKASNTGTEDYFGSIVAVTNNILAAGAPGEGSTATGIGGDQTNDDAPLSGAVYVFQRTGGTWQQEAYVKALNPDAGDFFGSAIALAGRTLAVGAFGEDSVATGITQAGALGDVGLDNDAIDSGAVYVYQRTAGAWAAEAYVKASNAEEGDTFGTSLSLSGNTLAAGAPEEDSAATGIGGDERNNEVLDSGAVYVFERTAGTWQQESYVKAFNTGAGDFFGISVVLENDVLAAGATGESSGAAGVGANQEDDTAFASGAVYVYVDVEDEWSQESYIKASNPDELDLFGFSLALSESILAVSAIWEDSAATGLGANQEDDTGVDSGAVYIYN